MRKKEREGKEERERESLDDVKDFMRFIQLYKLFSYKRERYKLKGFFLWEDRDVKKEKEKLLKIKITGFYSLL